MLLVNTGVYLFLAGVLKHAPLEAVYIYFDTATYDEIERDVKVTNKTSYQIAILILGKT